MREVLKALLPVAFKQKLSQMKKNHETKVEVSKNLLPTDVFLVGHPKSGNTWVAYMLAIILNEKIGKNVTMANVSEFVPNLHSPGVKIKDFNKWPSTRIFRNENPTWQDHYPKTIYLVRDPRAVLLSYYHHWLHSEQESHGTLEEFVDEMLEFGCIRRWEAWLVRWDLQVNDWVKREKKQPVKIIRYEDLIEDRSKTFREIVDFAGLTCSNSLFALAVEKGGFEAMQKSEKKHGAESFHGEKSAKGLFVRKGQVDSWKEEMPAHVIKKIEQKFQETMKLFGYL
ncbi:MAG: sulfotransferase domain-containing protein [Nitrospirales bacterium]